MSAVRGKLSAMGRRRIAFSVVVLAFLGLFGVMGWRFLVISVAGWFPEALGLFGGDFEPAHRIHFMVDSGVWVVITAGMVLQLLAPRKYAAASLMALLPFVAYFLAFGLTNFWKPAMMFGIFGGLVLLAAILNPAIRDLLSSFSLERASRVLLVLTIIAAVPLLAFAGTQFGLQTGAIDPGGQGHDHAGGAEHEKIHQQHVEHGHFALTMAFTIAILLVALLASFRPMGWVAPAVFAGAWAIYFGLLSTTFPEAASSAEPLWAVAAIAWGVAFVGATLLSRDTGTAAPYGDLPEAPATDD